MPYQNLSFTLAGADQALIIQKLDEIKALLPFLVNLTAKEKVSAMRLGPKSDKFIIDTLFTLENNPQYAPSFLNGAEFSKDLEAYIELVAIEFKLKSLMESVTDTRKAVLNELMPPSLAIYANVKKAAKANVPGSDASLNLLKPYFKKERKKK